MKSKINQVCEEILQEVKPKEEERNRISATVSKVTGRLRKEIKSLGVDAYPELEGSVAHGTWLAGERDIDIFILFSLHTPLDEVKKTGLELGRIVSDGKWRERYAEHPFIEASIDDYRIDIVPCYKISKFSERVTSVDRTPLHTEYLSNHFKQRERDETILLKAFMKGIGVYGAELRVNGFSGYLCELLTLNYRSLEEVLRGALRWTSREVIDIERQYSDKGALTGIFSQPLILIDPVDPTRNVAAAVSSDRIADLKAAARAFISSPIAAFFRPRKMQAIANTKLKALLRNRGTDTVFIQLSCQKISPDIVWGELGRSSKALKNLFELNDFQVLGWDSWTDESMLAVIVVELVSANIPSIKVHEGPLAGDPNQEKFLERHIHNEKTVAGPWIKNGKWQVELKREYTNAKNMIESTLKKEAPTSIGLSKDVGKWIKENGKTLLNQEILPLYSKNQDLAEFVTRYFTKRPSWLV